MIGFGAGHRREDVDLVHVRAAQGAERGGGPDAAVHVTAAVDARRLVPARDRAGGDHGIGKRRARGIRVAEQHSPSGVVVHRHDPGVAVNPVRRCPGAGGMLRMLVMTPVQRADQRPECRVLPPAVRQPAARPHPRGHLKRPQQGRPRQRQRAEAQVRQRRQRPVLRGEHDGIAQDPAGVPALPGHDLVQRRAAAQRGGQHAARARPDDEVEVGSGDRQPVLQAGQRTGRPGRAEHAARAEHQADSRVYGICGTGGMEAAHRPIRTKNHSRHICLRNPPTRSAGRG